MWKRLASALGLCASIACKDPGCIRNSQCPKHFSCVKSVCQPDRTDAGVAPDAGALMNSPDEPLDAATFRAAPIAG